MTQDDTAGTWALTLTQSYVTQPVPTAHPQQNESHRVYDAPRASPRSPHGVQITNSIRHRRTPGLLVTS